MEGTTIIRGVPHIVFDGHCRYLAIEGVRVDESIWYTATNGREAGPAEEIEILVRRIKEN